MCLNERSLNMNTIENESGQFFVDDAGALVRFECDAKNNLKLPYSPGSRRLMHLHIPEGVRILPPNAFRGFSVITQLTFPDSLEEVREGAFSRCSLPHVTLPIQAELGENVFSGSKIGEVTIPEGMNPERVCQAAHALHYSVSNAAKDWPAEYADIFYGRNEPLETWKQIHNSSGTFFLDSDGVLRHFSCDRYNYPNGSSDKGKILFRLHIPEGVKVIPGELFERYTVLWDMSFPETLKCIGTMGHNAFAGANLPDVVLPKHLELLGDFSFGTCTIRSLTIPGTLHSSLNYPGCARDFADTLVREIRVPAQYKELLEDLSKSWNYEKAEMESGVLADPDLGQLYRVTSKSGLLRGGVIIPRLLQEIAGNFS